MIKRGSKRWQYLRVSKIVRGLVTYRCRIARAELAPGLARRWFERFGAEETLLEGAREILPPYKWTLIERFQPGKESGNDAR